MVKSKEEAQREKDERGNASTTQGTTGANAFSVDNGSSDPIQRALESQHVSEEPRVIRSTIRSPSAERTGGLAGTILPVVEEAGEGTSPGRVMTADSGNSVSHEERQHARAATDSHVRGRRSPSDGLHSKPDSAVSFDSQHFVDTSEQSKPPATITA